MANEVQKKSGGLASIINSDAMKAQWAIVLPKTLTADRLARVAITQLRKVPRLGQCTQESFLGSMMKCAELGLEPNGRDAHLVPYGQECTFIAGYQGLLRLVRRDPSVKDVQVFTVRENDEFRWTPEGVEHSFGLSKPRGDVVGCYTKISWENGTVSYGEPMTRDQAEAIKKMSKASSNGPWVTSFDSMWMKSVIRRDSKYWPLTPEVMDAVNADLDADGIHLATDINVDSSPLEGFTAAEPVIQEKPEAGSSEDANPSSDPPEQPPAASPPPSAMPEQDDSLTPVEKLSKSACLAEIKMRFEEMDKAMYDEIKARHIHPDFQTKDAPVSTLREFLQELRNAAS